MVALTLGLITALLIKHFICDYPLQLKYMLEEKGSYLWTGGIHHAAIHGAGTFIVFALFGMAELASTLAVIDALIHYHVDWIKSKVNSRFALKSDQKNFWTALGLDQLAHQLTYVLLTLMALSAHSAG
jgi:hypothetical protein